jgi:hypothetical protein
MTAGLYMTNTKTTPAEKILLAALKKIVTTQGKVCDDFEVCRHKACTSSYCSWEIASRALKEFNEHKEKSARIAK